MTSEIKYKDRPPPCLKYLLSSQMEAHDSDEDRRSHRICPCIVRIRHEDGADRARDQRPRPVRPQGPHAGGREDGICRGDVASGDFLQIGRKDPPDDVVGRRLALLLKNQIYGTANLPVRELPVPRPL